MEFKDKVILVTGGSKGIGRGIALAFAGQGAKVAVSARDEEALAQVAEEIKSAGGEPLALVCDVTDQAQVENMAQAVHAKFGAVNVLVNNAGMAASHKFLDHPDDLWYRTLDVNLNGAYRVTKAIAPRMIEQDGGRIIMIASVTGKVASKYMAAYTTSKHALLGLTRSLAVEFNPFHITVNAICPGYVDTPMTQATITNMVEKTGMSPADARKYLEDLNPQRRLIEVDEVAALALFLAGDAAKGITGQAISVDGGAVMS